MFYFYMFLKSWIFIEIEKDLLLFMECKVCKIRINLFNKYWDIENLFF